MSADRLTPSAAAVARLRAARRAGGAPSEARTVATERGTVDIERLEFHEDGGRSHVDVWVAGLTPTEEPHYRIVNPPLLVPDVSGEHVIGDEHFREDPIGAIALVVATLGGARQERRRRVG